MGDNEMKVNVSLKVKNRGKWEFLSLINAGDNWYEASGDCDLFQQKQRYGTGHFHKGFHAKCNT